MSISSLDLQDIDIMSDSLSLMGEAVDSMNDDGTVRYGDIVLNIAAKVSSKAAAFVSHLSQTAVFVRVMLSKGTLTNFVPGREDQLFSPSLLLAEHIERGLIPLEGKAVVELGAGCALPSILAATLPAPPALVAITDYPDEAILANLRINLHANARLINPKCSVVCAGHEWGTDPARILESLKLNPQASSSGFDIAILSDLLHFHNSHPAILASLTSLLARTSSARAYIASGTYTPAHVCANFLRLATAAGLVLSEGAPEDEWHGSREVWRIGKLSPNDLGVRKAMCRWWVARWDDGVLSASKALG
ncbi:hypothetical protein ACEPAG_8550 [Sanghuangporus baumii]